MNRAERGGLPLVERFVHLAMTLAVGPPGPHDAPGNEDQGRQCRPGHRDLVADADIQQAESDESERDQTDFAQHTNLLVGATMRPESIPGPLH